MGTEMKADQIAVAAECLNMDPEVAAGRTYDVRNGIIRVSSRLRGVGTPRTPRSARSWRAPAYREIKPQIDQARPAEVDAAGRGPAVPAVPGGGFGSARLAC